MASLQASPKTVAASGVGRYVGALAIAEHAPREEFRLIWLYAQRFVHAFGKYEALFAKLRRTIAEGGLDCLDHFTRSSVGQVCYDALVFPNFISARCDVPRPIIQLIPRALVVALRFAGG